MIKYKLFCKNCNLKFDSWFASSNEYERLKKDKIAIITIGRWQPPHAGHLELIDGTYEKVTKFKEAGFKGADGYIWIAPRPDKKIGNFNFKKKLTALRLEYQNSLRGEFYLNKLILKSIYPFGVIRTKTNFYPKTKIIVYPKKIKPTDSLLREFAISKNIKLDEFEGIDEFKNGDSYSKIAWKKSTLEKKYIKIFKDKQEEQKFILDLDKYREIEFELLLSYSVYIIKYYYLNKLNLTLKHKSNIFILDNNEKSLNQIYKYLANVKN